MNHLTVSRKVQETVDDVMLFISDKAVSLREVMQDETYKEREAELVIAIVQEFRKKGYKV